MAGSLSDFAENELLDHIMGVGSYTMPTVYLALFTAAPTDAGGGTEVTGGSYARVAIAADFATPASGGAISNDGEVTFPTATAAWGTVVAIGYFDALTVGNMLAWADLAVSKAVGDGDTAKFAIGDLDVTLT